MRKKIIILIFVFLTITNILVLSSCFSGDFWDFDNNDSSGNWWWEYGETEFFKYKIVKSKNSNTNEVTAVVDIYDVTEKACEEEYLIIPKYIDGMEVRWLTHKYSLSGGKDLAANYKNLKAKRIYLPNIHRYTSEWLFNSESLEYVISIEDTRPTAFTFVWETQWISKYGKRVCFPELKEKWAELEKECDEITFSANVLFHNNYAQEVNYGYSWVDYLEEGENLPVYPPEPQRENYSFGGWYGEPECINKVDLFEIVKDKNDIHIYAKWIRCNL